MASLLTIAGRLVEDASRWVLLLLRSRESVQAENLAGGFLRPEMAEFEAAGA